MIDKRIKSTIISLSWKFSISRRIFKQKSEESSLLGLDWQIQTIIAVGFANPTGAVLV